MVELLVGTLDVARGCIVGRDGGLVRLTSTELALLCFLLDRPGEAVSRETLLQEVWGYREGVSSRTLDTAIKTLRQKIEPNRKAPEHLHTVWGVGYRFEPLPPEDGLVGRTELMTRIWHTLERSKHPVLLWGPGGVGKSSLARATADRLAGALVVKCGSAKSVPQLEALIGQALPGEGSWADRLASVPFVVLDELEQVEDLAPWLGAWPQMPQRGVLITSRQNHGLESSLTIAVPPLETADVVELLGRRLEEAGRSGTDADILEAIAPLVGGLPLAVELAARRAALWTDIELREGAKLLGRMPAEGAVGAAIRWSLDHLSEDQRRVAKAVAHFVGPFTVADAVVLIGESAVWILPELVEAGLAQRGSQGGVGLLSPVRELLLREGTPQAEAHAGWALDLERGQRRVTELLGALGRNLPTDLGIEVRLILVEGLRSSDMVLRLELAEEALSRVTGRSATRVRALLARLDARVTLGIASVAHAEEVLGEADDLGRADLLGHAASHCAALLRGAGELQASVSVATAVLPRLLQAPAGRLLVLSELGLASRLLGDFGAAVRWLEEANELALALEDRMRAAHIMLRTGAVHRCLGHLDRAHQWCERALEVAESVESPMMWANARGALAECLLDAGQTELARQNLETCRALLEDHPNPFLSVMLVATEGFLLLAEEDLVGAQVVAARARGALAYTEVASACALALMVAVVAVRCRPESAGSDLDVAIGLCVARGQVQLESIALGYKARWSGAEEDVEALRGRVDGSPDWVMAQIWREIEEPGAGDQGLFHIRQLRARSFESRPGRPG